MPARKSKASHPATSSAQKYLRLLGYVRPYWKGFALAMVCMVLLAATEPLFPALMKPLLDKGFSGQARNDLWIVPLAIIAIFLVRGVLSFSSGYLMAWVTNHVVMDLRIAMFDKVLRLPTRYYDNQSTGALMSRITYDVTNVTGAATSALTTLVRDSLTIVGLLAWLFYLNPDCPLERARIPQPSASEFGFARGAHNRVYGRRARARRRRAQAGRRGVGHFDTLS